MSYSFDPEQLKNPKEPTEFKWDWQLDNPLHHLPYPEDPTPYTPRDRYLGHPNIRRANSQPTQWTAEMIEEYKKCAESVEYFCTRYYQIISLDHGQVKISPFPYQREFWKVVESNRFVIALQSRQSAKCVAAGTKVDIEFPDGFRVRMKIDAFLKLLSAITRQQQLGTHDLEQILQAVSEIDLVAARKIRQRWLSVTRVLSDAVSGHRQSTDAKTKISRTQEEAVRVDERRLTPSQSVERKFVESYDVTGFKARVGDKWVEIRSAHVTVPYRAFIVGTDSGKKLKCADDHVLFSRGVERFAKDFVVGDVIDTDDGEETVTTIVDTESEETMYDLTVDGERYSTDGFISHNTTSIVGWLLHHALFSKTTKRIALVAHKLDQAREIMERFQIALESLPFFLQLGVKTYNKGRIVFENETTVFAAATSSGSLRGKSVNVVYLDEFAFIHNDRAFMKATWPVISSGKTTKILITSTANGAKGAFYNIWQGAVLGVNGFVPFRVDWWDVPGRDAKWKAEQIAQTSQEDFDQEFCNEFQGTSNTLISGNVLFNMTPRPPVWTGDDGVEVFDKPVDGHSYVMTVDVCKGRGKDRSTFSVWDVTDGRLEQVATYQNSTISPIIYPDLLYKWAKIYNRALVVIESNDEGASVARSLYYDLDYEEVFVENLSKAHGIGVFVDKKVKRVGCSNMKDLIETGKMIVRDKRTIEELLTFVPTGSGYEAEPGYYDDLVQNLWLMSWYVDTDVFKAHAGTGNLRERLRAEREKAIEESVPFVGLFPGMSDPIEDLIAKGYMPPTLDGWDFMRNVKKEEEEEVEAPWDPPFLGPDD